MPELANLLLIIDLTATTALIAAIALMAPTQGPWVGIATLGRLAIIPGASHSSTGGYMGWPLSAWPTGGSDPR